MEHLFLLDDWKELFESSGLKQVEDFFAFQDGILINQNRRRRVISFSMDEPSRSSRFFIKQFYNVHFKDIFFALRCFGRPYSQARIEFENARMLILNNIDTYRPVGFGEITIGGMEKKSFFITEKMDHRCLKDFLIEQWPTFSTNQKIHFYRQLGQFVSKIHGARIHLPDLYGYHIYLTAAADSEDYTFAVIDLHRMQSHVRSRRKYIKDLAALFFSIPPSYFPEDCKHHFLESYLSEWVAPIKNRLRNQIELRVKTLWNRRPHPDWDC